MTTREALHKLLDRLNDEEIEAMAQIAQRWGWSGRLPASGSSKQYIESRQYPVLAAVWDNDSDAIFDDL